LHDAALVKFPPKLAE
jgi:hypothetical protein